MHPSEDRIGRKNAAHRELWRFWPGFMNSPGEHQDAVEWLPESATPEVLDVFCDAFRDYPVMRFVLAVPEGPHDPARLRTLIRLFVAARVLRGEPMLGVFQDDRLVAAAIVSYPHRDTTPRSFLDLRAAIWAELGDDARRRYDDCGEVWRDFAVVEPHVHLNMIGVRQALQGTGLAAQLLARVHAHSLERPDSIGVTLTTEDPRNVAFYEHAGYQVLGHARIAPGIETWGFLRRDSKLR